MNRLLTTFVAISLAGCAVDANDPDQGDGAGKADDTCESAAYKTWLVGTYFPRLGQLGLPFTDEGLASALEAAADKPCTTGSDADYTLWFGQFSLHVNPLIARHRTSFGPAVTTQMKYDQALIAATPSAAEIRTLTAFLAAAPERSGAGGYAAWVAGYEPLLSVVYTGKGTTSTIFERSGVITEAEQPLLAALEDARPETAQEGAYATWFAMFAPWTKKAFAPLADADAKAFAAQLLELRPAARADADYLTWLVAFHDLDRPAYATATSATPRVIAELDALAAARPIGTGGGARSYKPWFGVFGEAFGAALGTDLVLTDLEKARLERLVISKPCSTNPADASLFAALDARRATFGAAGAYLERAAPEPCTQ